MLISVHFDFFLAD